MLLGCAMIMFSLATVDVVLELGFLFWFVVKKNEVPEDDLHFKFLIYITSKWVFALNFSGFSNMYILVLSPIV